ncbi:MAG: response regulator [Actinobacteria bacterium]|nr:response regulator [Actinomycetota bacterium]
MDRAHGSAVVLCVDDEESNRQLISKLFARRRPQDVIISAASGQAALEYARAEAPQLVLLDLGLPGMSGDEVLRKLKQDHDVPVIVISGHADQATRDRLLGEGADAYVAKPFDAGELFRLIERFI